MKSLKMKSGFLCSVFGLHIFLVLSTVWAAGSDPPGFTGEELEKTFEEFLNEGSPTEEMDWIKDGLGDILRNNPPNSQDSEAVGGVDEEKDNDEDFDSLFDEPKTTGGVDEEKDSDKDSLFDGSDDDPNNFNDGDSVQDPMTTGGNSDQDPKTTGGVDGKGDIVDLTGPDVDGKGDIIDLTGPDVDGDRDRDRDIVDFTAKYEEYVDHGIKARSVFKWASGPKGCDGREKPIERGLNEMVTLLKKTIAKLDLILTYKRFKVPLILEDIGENIMVATGHLWGVEWNSYLNSAQTRAVRYSDSDRDILVVVRENFEFMLRALLTISESTNHLRLVCGKDNVEVKKNATGEYWHFKDFDLDIKIPKDASSSLCGPKSGTLVWVDEQIDNQLVMFCDSLWRNHRWSLDYFIKDQVKYATHFLDQKMTLGGIMMHVFMHAFKLASDLKIEARFGVRKGTDETDTTLVPVWTYYWCAALARKDTRDRVELEFRKAPKSVQNHVLYATWIALDYIRWDKKEHLPMRFEI